MAKQATGNHALPPIPTGFGLPFYYSTLFNIEVAFLVDRARVLPYLKNTGLIASDFKGKALVSFNYQLYNGQFSNGTSTVQEIELNIVCYPESQQEKVAFVSAEEYLRGDEQTKFMGHHRVWVPCDNDNAIAAGKQLFGEPKFKTSFSVNFPVLNSPDVTDWMVQCNDPAAVVKVGAPPPKNFIFRCVANVQGLTGEASAFSPITEYGLFEGKLIGCRWNILQPTQLYFLKPAEARRRVQLQFGPSKNAMRKDMEALIGDTPALAVRTSASAPAAIQSRAYYV